MKKRNKKSFAIFILTHGRPDKVITFDSLRKAGYTGKIVLVIDNEDATAERYRENFGADNVVMFDKAAVGETFDLADTQKDRRVIVFARNASFDIARQLGLDYFAQFDDDYNAFMYRHSEGEVLGYTPISSMDEVVTALLVLLEDTDAMSVAMSQGGDHIGGIDGVFRKGLLRKAMNSWFFRTDRPITFVGRINEDVNAYVGYGSRGQVFFTATKIQLTQAATQKVAGGMSEVYAAVGTYMKSMYTVMMSPSCVKVSFMGQSNPRMHHFIEQEHAYPKIISDKYVK